ncbi:hypothetical protein [Actinoplanes sp. HUAS TT8]|uniref:hypothetical protein n=1 Tax=Actinoplanes sp. HUAS TT8 TaxID=3447453 RepID=UPI003F523EFF
MTATTTTGRDQPPRNPALISPDDAGGGDDGYFAALRALRARAMPATAEMRDAHLAASTEQRAAAMAGILNTVLASMLAPVDLR